MYAAWQGQDNAVAILLRNHASITRRSNDQETALHKAAFRGHAAVLKILLEAGAEIDDVDEDGETPLILAASAGHLPVVRLLLARQADPNLATRQGWTALMLAARNGHQSVVEALAPVSRVNDVAAQGETALSMALYGGHVGIIEQILKAGANESGALWLWRGIRLSRSGQNAEALPCLEKAATDRQSSGRVWNVTIDGVRYDVPAPRCLVSLALGVCHQQLNQTEEAVQAFKKGLENAPQTAGSVVLVRRVRQIPGLTETEVLEVTRDEIQRHVSDPAAAWRVQVKQNKDEQGGGRHSRSTIHSGRMVRGFF
jgi:tetratricopeptide (TPR) repeat protein